MDKTVAFILVSLCVAGGLAIENVLDPKLSNSPFENLMELETASDEQLQDLAAADPKYAVRNFFRQQQDHRRPKIKSNPTPVSSLLYNIKKKEDAEVEGLSAAEKILFKRRLAVSQKNVEQKPKSELGIEHLETASEAVTEDDSSTSVYTPDFSDDSQFITTDLPYTFESFPKIDLRKLRPTEAATEEGKVKESTTEVLEIVYASSEDSLEGQDKTTLFLTESESPPDTTVDKPPPVEAAQFDVQAEVIQPTSSTNLLTTFQDINAYLFKPAATNIPPSSEVKNSLSKELNTLEDLLNSAEAVREDIKETPKRKRKIASNHHEDNPNPNLPAVAPPTFYLAPPPESPIPDFDDEGGDSVQVNEVFLEDVHNEGNTVLVLTEEDAAVAKEVMKATNGWDDLDDDIITAIEEVLDIHIPVDSKLLYRKGIRQI